MVKTTVLKSGVGLASTLALLCSSSTAFAGVATYQVFKIQNGTGQDVTAIYLTPEESNSTSGEILKDKVLGDNQSLSIKLKLNRACTSKREFIYNLKAELENGSVYSKTIDVCEGRITLGNGERPRETRNDTTSSPTSQAVPVNYPAPSNATLPAVLSILKPGVPVDATVDARIKAALGAQGLAPASCSSNSVAVFKVNGQYIACAYPNSNFGPGNYSMKIPQQL
jgi:hypothetical protein